MEDKVNTDLSISAEVLEEMASIAATEVEGVAATVGKAVDIKGIVNKGRLFKPASVVEKNGTIDISLYISVKQSANVKTVAEAVQKNVKEKVQSMTGSAITKVNVTVADVEISDQA